MPNPSDNYAKKCLNEPDCPLFDVVPPRGKDYNAVVRLLSDRTAEFLHAENGGTNGRRVQELLYSDIPG